jgi:predicted DNA-binding transcriptional regulator AlpA
MNTSIRPDTVKLISKLLSPWTDEGILSVPEKREVIAQLRYLSEKGVERPCVIPKLIDQTEAATILGIGLSNFKKLEKAGQFPFKRKMVGTSVRYRNTDIVQFLMTED